MESKDRLRLSMDKEKFEELVEEALSAVPAQFKKYIENVAFLVEERPSADSRHLGGKTPFSTILGLYHGVPFKHRGPFYGNLPPDVIVIYKDPIEKVCLTPEEIQDKVREVVLHEIGHYFGLSEKELDEIENFNKKDPKR